MAIKWIMEKMRNKLIQIIIVTLFFLTLISMATFKLISDDLERDSRIDGEVTNEQRLQEEINNLVEKDKKRKE